MKRHRGARGRVTGVGGSYAKIYIFVHAMGEEHYVLRDQHPTIHRAGAGVSISGPCPYFGRFLSSMLYCRTSTNLIKQNSFYVYVCTTYAPDPVPPGSPGGTYLQRSLTTHRGHKPPLHWNATGRWSNHWFGSMTIYNLYKVQHSTDVCSVYVGRCPRSGLELHIP